MMPKPNDRVSPDRPDEETPSKRGNRLAIGLLTLAAGAVAIVALTQPDPPPTADSATTTTLVPPDSPTTTTEVLIRGQQLEFRTIELDAFPILLAELNRGELLLITSKSGRDSVRFEDVEVSSSVDGATWEDIGHTIDPEASLHGADITAQGLILSGRDAAGSPAFWTSQDGRSWHEVVIDAGATWPVSAVGASDQLLVAVGYPDIWAEIVDRLTEEVGDLAPWFHAWQEDSGEISLTVSPLWIPIARFSLEDLGFDTADLDSPPEIEVHASADGGATWYPAALPEGGTAGEMFVGADGRLWIVVHEEYVARLYSTLDGITWAEQSGFPGTGAMVKPWRGGFFASDFNLDITVVGRDAITVDDRARGLFAEPGQWFATDIATGDAGMAIAVRRTSRGLEESDVTIEHNGMTVTVTAYQVTIEDADGRVIISVPRHTEPREIEISYDSVTEEVVFTRSGTDEVTIPIDDLLEIEAKVQGEWARRSERDGNVLLTSSDGCTWNSQLLRLPNAGFQVYDVSMVGELLAVTIGQTFAPPRTAQIWWAELRDGPRECPAE